MESNQSTTFRCAFMGAVEDTAHIGNHVAGKKADEYNFVENASAADLRRESVYVALRCCTVIFSRVTPMQKEHVVRFVHDHRKHVKQKTKTFPRAFSSALLSSSYRCPSVDNIVPSHLCFGRNSSNFDHTVVPDTTAKTTTIHDDEVYDPRPVASSSHCATVAATITHESRGQ